MTSNRIPGAQQNHYQEIRLDKNEEEKIPGLDAYNHNRNRNYTTQTIAEDNLPCHRLRSSLRRKKLFFIWFFAGQGKKTTVVITMAGKKTGFFPPRNFWVFLFFGTLGKSCSVSGCLLQFFLVKLFSTHDVWHWSKAGSHLAPL